MRHALEVRVPFLDHRVVELAFRMSSDLKLHGRVKKYILLETFKSILPKSLHHRPKWGFEMPIGEWLREDLRFLLEDYLSKERIEAQGFFAYEEIERLKDCLLHYRSDTSWHLWNLIVFQFWYAQYMS